MNKHILSDRIVSSGSNTRAEALSKVNFIHAKLKLDSALGIQRGCLNHVGSVAVLNLRTTTSQKCAAVLRRFRSGLVFKAHRLCVSLNSRLESNTEEGEEGCGINTRAGALSNVKFIEAKR